jgi:hypothetical protein
LALVHARIGVVPNLDKSLRALNPDHSTILRTKNTLSLPKIWSRAKSSRIRE